MKEKNKSYLMKFISVTVGLMITLSGISTPVIASEFTTNIRTNVASQKQSVSASQSTYKASSVGASHRTRAGQYVDIDMINNQDITTLAVMFSIDGGSNWSGQVTANRLGNDSKSYHYGITRSWVYEAMAPDGFSNYNAIKIINTNTSAEITVNLNDDQIGADLAYKLNPGFTAGSWRTFYSSSQQVDVNNIVDKDNGRYELYGMKTTFYDIYTNNEVANGWGNALESDARRDWEPYEDFTGFEGLFVESGADWTYPLYFGNFYNKADGYFPSFKNKVNNSNGLQSYDTSVQGLVRKKLDSSGNIKSSPAGGGDDYDGGGVTLPIFDSQFLANNNVGQVINGLFPIRSYEKSPHGTVNHFGFNSDPNNTFNNDGVVDNIWFSRDNKLWNDTSKGAWQVNYGSDSKYRINDALSKFSSPVQPDGKGFFPFDTSVDAGGKTNNNAWNFGFALKSEINFHLPDGGTEDGEQLFYEYTGDDDLWVFLDDVLVLDLGGDHKKSGGSINFATLQATYVNNGYDIRTDSSASPGRVEAFPNKFGASGDQPFNNHDIRKKHKLTMFYIERGLAESNLHFSFSFTPTNCELELEKEVDTANVNSALKSQVEANNFDFNIYRDHSGSGYTPLANFNYQYVDGSGNTEKKQTNGDGKLTVQDGYVSSFVNSHSEGDGAKIVEADTSPMTYETVYEMSDLYTGEHILDGSGKQCEFNWGQRGDLHDIIGRSVKFTNTPNVSPLKVTKKVVDEHGTDMPDDETEFDYALKLDLNAGTTYIPYKLEYKKTAKDGTVTTGTLPENGSFKLKNSESIVFEGLPQGITYKVVETPKAGYTTDHYTHTGTVGNSEVTVSYVNHVFNTEISFIKYFDGDIETTADRFTFDLYETTSGSDVLIEAGKKNDDNGTVTFSELQYTEAGIHYYRIDEVDKTNPLINYGDSIYVKVEVVKESTDKLKSIITYYSDSGCTEVLDTPQIDNSTKLGEITIKKIDKDTRATLKGAKFKLVPAKVDVDGTWSDLTPTAFDDATEYEVVNDDGTLTFSNLNIGTTLPYYFQLYEVVAPGGYQLLGSTVKITINELTTDFTGQIWEYNDIIEIENVVDTTLPLTGGIGWIALGIMAIILISAAVIVQFQNKKKTS